MNRRNVETLKYERTQARVRLHTDQEIDTYLRYNSLVRKNLIWSFAIRQRYYESDRIP